MTTTEKIDSAPLAMSKEQRSNKPDERGFIYRDASIDAAAMSDDSMECGLAFSSEQPVERYDWRDGKSYMEVLSHESGAVDLSRLNNKHPLLVNHDTNDQVGVVKSAVVDADKVGRATVKFSKSTRGKEIWQDVKDGIRGLVSVGYQVGREVSREVRDGMEYRTFEWMPYELSLVPIPADTTVGVGRANAPTENQTATISQPQTKSMSEPITPAPAAPAPVAAPAVVRSESAIKADAMKSAGEILAIGRKFNKFDEAQKALETGKSVDEFRAEVMETLKSGSTAETTTQIVKARSVGEYLATNEQFRAFAKQQGRRNLSLDVPLDFNVRTTGDPATTTGLTSIDKQPGIVLLGVQPPRVADLLMQTATQNTAIRYIKENSLTNAAAATAENGSLGEATWDLVEVDANVKKIGAIARVTDEFFADYDATRDYINLRLAYMVGIKEDNELLNGDGSSNRITGLLNFSGIQTQAQGADSALDALYKGINKIRRLGYYEPDAIVLNPIDLEGFRLAKDKNGQYYFGGPFTGSYGQPGTPGFVLMIWGLPVVWTTSIASGTALVGAFRMGAQIFRKLGLTIETTNSDASDFQSNRIAIRANTRLALAVYRPLAFCTVTGLN